MWAPWPDDSTHDQLTPRWHLYQRRGGHRTSTDDLITAWFAATSYPNAETHLDLGCGIGSVLLMTHYLVRPRFSVGVEAQAQSATMARRSIDELPDEVDITVVHSDFRDFDDQRGPYELITGSPPYFPPGTGVPSPDPQRHACRFELRGGIEEYCATAAVHLAARGRFVVVFPAAQHERLRNAATRAGLRESARLETWMRSDDAEPFLCVYVLQHNDELASDVPTVTCLTVREANGEVSAEYQRVRSALGW